MTGKVIDGKKLVFVSILRAGTGILDGMLAVVPGARVGHIGLYRDPKTLGASRVLLQDARATCTNATWWWSTRCWPPATRPIAAVDRLKEFKPEVDQVRLPADLSRGHRRHGRGPSRRADLHRRHRPCSSTSTATSCRASAMPATASSGQSRSHVRFPDTDRHARGLHRSRQPDERARTQSVHRGVAGVRPAGARGRAPFW